MRRAMIVAAAVGALALSAWKVPNADARGLDRGRVAEQRALSGMLPASLAPASVAERPEPDTMTSSFEVSGVRVILRRNSANDVVAANLYLLGGTRQVADSNAGVEPMMLWVSEFGTKRYSREALRLKTAELGSTIVVEPRDDWTMFGFRGVRSTFDSTWTILADRLMEPTLDSGAVELIRSQVLSAVRQRRDSPDNLVQYLADSIAFSPSHYALSPAGTESSIAALTAAALRRYRDTQLVTSRMLLVVVGNVERPQVEKLVRNTIGKLPKGSYQWTAPQGVGPRPSAAVLVERSLPTNYIQGYYSGPSATNPDYQALRVATAVLTGRMFAEIRSRRNLTYAVDAPFVERAVAAGGLYVTTTSPDTVLVLMRQEISDLQNGLVDADNLQVIISQFITEYFLNTETNAAQADFLARAQLYRGDWRTANNFADELRQVTPVDVRNAARKYIHGVRFAYVGDTTGVSRELLGAF
jgi:zinc protease